MVRRDGGLVGPPDESPFRALTALAAEAYPWCSPYGGNTRRTRCPTSPSGRGDYPGELRAAAEAVRPLLPIAAEATEVTLMTGPDPAAAAGTPGRWQTVATFPPGVARGHRRRTTAVAKRRAPGAGVRQNPDQQTTSERDALEQYLDYQRETILLKTEGLTREQLGSRSDLRPHPGGHPVPPRAERGGLVRGRLPRPTRARRVAGHRLGGRPGLRVPHRPDQGARVAARPLPGCLRARPAGRRVGRQPGPALRLHPDRRPAVHPPPGAAAPHRGNRAARRAGGFAP